MLPDTEQLAKLQKDELHNLNVMRSNAIVMLTSKLSKLTNDEYRINEQYSSIYKFILENEPPFNEKTLTEFQTLKVKSKDIKETIINLKEHLVLLRNGYDPRRLSREILA